MSGPNTDYDPVEVTPLKAEEVERMRDEAIAAIAGANDLDQLKQVRLDHSGDRSPLALANREIGALPPQARKEAGARVGQARGAVNKALVERSTTLEHEHEERMLVEVSRTGDGGDRLVAHALDLFGLERGDLDRVVVSVGAGHGSLSLRVAVGRRDSRWVGRGFSPDPAANRSIC